MKIQVTQADPEAQYSSLLEPGDFVPYFYIDNAGQVLDIQAKAGSEISLVFIDHQFPDLIKTALDTPLPHNRFVISNGPCTIADSRLFFDANVYRLFARAGCPVSVCVCDANLKIRVFHSGSSVAELFAEMAQKIQRITTGSPPPVLLVPDVISSDLSSRLIQYLDNNQDAAFRNSTEYKSRSHIHPAHELEKELDDKLCKSLLPEIEKVFYSEISHRETYKICCYDADDDGCFGKHRDTIDPHLHRRYALTLVLNDDFEGGGISFPEYTDEVMEVPSNWAVVFPGSLYHQVHNIGIGRRYVLISFLFSEAEAQLKDDSERYRFLIKRDLGNIAINKLTPDYESR